VTVLELGSLFFLRKFTTATNSKTMIILSSAIIVNFTVSRPKHVKVLELLVTWGQDFLTNKIKGLRIKAKALSELCVLHCI
jgi:hypothetical protein